MTSVFLLDFGGPESPADVRPFLKNLFADKNIFPFPFGQNFFASLVAFLRAPKVKEQYAKIGGRSPLPGQSRDIAAKLEASLRQSGLDMRVHVGMRYSKPSIREALGRLASENPHEIIVVPMFPHYSTATTLSVLEAFKKAYTELGLKIPWQAIEWWYDRPEYVAAWCYSIRNALDHFPPSQRGGVPILFTAHSLPVSFVKERRDPYPDQIRESCEKIMTYLGGENPSYLSYQSRVGPMEWLKPATIEFVGELGKKGIRRLVIVPISFLTDHIETRYEIDHEIIPVAHRAGIEKVVRCEALYYTPYLLKVLETLVLKKRLSFTAP